MTSNLSKIIPLKSFLLGAAVSDSKAKAQAIDLVQTCIFKLQSEKKLEERKVFYQMTLCEIHRHCNHSDLDHERKALGNLIENNNMSDYLENFLEVVSHTTMEKSVGGGGALSYVSKGTVKKIGDRSVFFDDYSPSYPDDSLISMQELLEAVNLLEDEISASEYRFLYHLRLADIVAKHFP